MKSAKSTTWRERSSLLGIIAGLSVAGAEIVNQPVTVKLVVASVMVLAVVAGELRTWWTSRPSRDADRVLVSLLNASLGFAALSFALS
jgi:hypothetical protein